MSAYRYAPRGLNRRGYHNGETFAIDVKIQAQCFGKPTTRMITEAVRIEELPDENSLNSKSEWTYVKLPRVNVV